MNVAAPVQEWATELRKLAAGMTIAAFLLVPPVSSAAIRVQSRPHGERPELVSSIPDGPLDPQTARFRTPEGLDTALVLAAPQEDEDEDRAILPARLREVSGLPVTALAQVAGVSKVTYHNWLKGEGISDENAARLAELLGTFRLLRDLRGTGLPQFLESAGPAGRPLDLLLREEAEAVIGLALQPASVGAIEPVVADAVWETSGLSGWLQPVRRLDWGAPRLTDGELQDTLASLNLRPWADEDAPIDGGDEPAFVAHVQFAG